jgi:hypothetical protein
MHSPRRVWSGVLSDILILVNVFFFTSFVPGSSGLAQINTARILDRYEECLLTKSLGEYKCMLLRELVFSLSNAEYSNFVFSLAERAGISIIGYYDPNPDESSNRNPNAPLRFLRSCDNGKLLGFYEPSSRSIMICANNMKGSGEALLALQHEIVHAAQHCWGWTLSADSYLNERFFQGPLDPIDPPEVVESYAKEKWVNELEARRQLNSTMSLDVISLLYTACRLKR